MEFSIEYLKGYKAAMQHVVARGDKFAEAMFTNPTSTTVYGVALGNLFEAFAGEVKIISKDLEKLEGEV